MMMVAPVAVHILAPVLDKYGFEAQPTGLIAFGQQLDAFAKADAEVAAVAESLKAELQLDF